MGLVMAEKLPIVKIRLNEMLEPKELLAVIGTVVTAAVVGVPLITPLEAFRERPAGRPVAVKEVGLLVPVIV